MALDHQAQTPAQPDKTWSELASPDKLAEIDRLIGKRKIDAAVAERERRKRKPSN